MNFNQIKDWLENAIDETMGKPFRKGMEQFGHFAIWPGGIGGIPGAGVILLIDMIPGTNLPIWAYITAALITSTVNTLYREYKQNIGDTPDERTLVVLPVGPGLPVNWDMVLDICVSIPGGLIAGIGFFFIPT